jgi:hypothetical protein
MIRKFSDDLEGVLVEAELVSETFERRLPTVAEHEYLALYVPEKRVEIGWVLGGKVKVDPNQAIDT